MAANVLLYHLHSLPMDDSSVPRGPSSHLRFPMRRIMESNRLSTIRSQLVLGHANPPRCSRHR